jgi:hypothetical protein
VGCSSVAFRLKAEATEIDLKAEATEIDLKAEATEIDLKAEATEIDQMAEATEIDQMDRSSTGYGGHRALVRCLICDWGLLVSETLDFVASAFRRKKRPQPT